MRTPRNRTLREPGRNASPLSRAADPRVPNEAGFITRSQLNDGLTTFLTTVEARFRAAGYVTRGALNAALAGIAGFASIADVAAEAAARDAAIALSEARQRAAGWVTRGGMVAYVTDAINAALGAISGYATSADLAAEAVARDAAIALANARVLAMGWINRGALNAAVNLEADYRAAGDALALPKAGGTMTGALTLAADPVTPLGAATKQYADGLVIAAGAPTYLSHALCGGR